LGCGYVCLQFKGAKDARVGAASLFALAAVSLCCVLFRFLLQSAAASHGRWVAAFLIIVAYFLFAPAVASALYSLLFEGSKTLGLAALILAGVPTLTMLILLDGLLLLPFWFLGIMGVAKVIKWRATKLPANVAD